MSKSITCERCLAYVNQMTSSLINHYKSHASFQKLSTFTHVDLLKTFISKVLTAVKTKHLPTLSLTDELLAGIVEFALNEDTPRLIPPLPAFSPLRERSPLVPAFISAKRFEPELIQIPELRAPMFAPMATPANPEMNFPPPTFFSPVLQPNFQSTSLQSRGPTPSPNQMFSAVYPSIMAPYQLPFMPTPNEYFMMSPYQMHPFEQVQRGQQKTGDFTLFTNKYVNNG